jgi:hypothetical protein
LPAVADNEVGGFGTVVTVDVVNEELEIAEKAFVEVSVTA